MVYYFGIFLFTVLSKFATIKFGRSTKSVFDLLVYSFITGTVASLFFLVTSKFSISLNFVTVIYSAIFSAVVIAAHFSSLILFRFMDVSSATVLSGTFTLILTFVVSTFLLRESSDITGILRCLIMIVASLLLHFPVRNGGVIRLHLESKGVIAVFVSASISVFASVISKSYAADSRVTDSDSFFFLTNIFIVVFSLAAILITKKGEFKTVFDELRRFSRSGYFFITVSTVSSNVCSLLQILIFAAGDGILLYTPISGAISLIASGIVAVAVKEKPKVIPLALACTSLFISLI